MLLIGYSGLGGKELFEISMQNSSGQEVAYGDWLGFVNACTSLNNRLNNNKDELIRSLLCNSLSIRKIYNSERMIKSVSDALDCWEEQLK